MYTTIVTPELDAIVSEIQISAPPERVFQAISDAGELRRWFNGGEECPVKFWKMDARVGGQYSFASATASHPVNGVSEFKCHGEIVECDPPRVLAYTWIGNWHDDPTSTTIVRWELTPTKGGTHVKVTHSGLASLPVARKDYSGGWPGVVEHLKKFAEHRE
ncbi:MAG TPA: SRPBCC domain-containing protein [Candidatus Eisenbacteria bacterium]|nr:SRPBCC domain-containing protein [Candidatus Eisenbacteria bacterium]